MMKPSLYFLLTLVLIWLSGVGCSSFADSTNSSSFSGNETKQGNLIEPLKLNQPLYIVKGSQRKICQDVYKLFALPENAHYLYTYDERKDIPSGYKNELHSMRSLYIPRTKEFSMFEEPIWEEVSYEEAHKRLPEFIDYLTEVFGNHGFDVEYGKNYKIQKSQIDMNLDGELEAVYRSVSTENIDGVKDLVTNYLSIHSREMGLGLHRKGQIVFHEGIPTFFTRELGLDEFHVTISLEDGNINNVKIMPKYKPMGCQFSVEEKRDIGD